MWQLRFRPQYYVLIIVFFCTLTFSCGQKTLTTNSVFKIEADLSSFGVESDDYPSIHCLINLADNSSNCKKWYYSPKHKDSAYSLSNNEMKQIYKILQRADLKNLKRKYIVNMSDQPKSTITFYTNTGKIVIEDYGLRGEYPLQDLYKIIYKL